MKMLSFYPKEKKNPFVNKVWRPTWYSISLLGCWVSWNWTQKSIFESYIIVTIIETLNFILVSVLFIIIRTLTIGMPLMCEQLPWCSSLIELKKMQYSFHLAHNFSWDQCSPLAALTFYPKMVFENCTLSLHQYSQTPSLWPKKPKQKSSNQ